MKVLVTGGAGYVGSAICQALIANGHVPVILDTLFSGREYFVTDKIFYKVDIGDVEAIGEIFKSHGDIQVAIHCAERATVDSSVFNPYEYYISNVVKSIQLCGAIAEQGCNRLIYCSSASVYEDVAGYMVSEHSPIHPRSPFGRSKYMTEMVLEDFCNAYDLNCITLRYFNPIGAAPDMSCGPEISNSGNIVSRIIHSVNEDVPFVINGNDWATRDGTCIRDYTHVWDVAMAHVKAVENFKEAFTVDEGANIKYLPINIGSGVGSTVKEVVTAFENISGDKVDIRPGPRRPGDICGSYASTSLARKCLDWHSEMTMEEAILDAIRWENVKKAR